MLLAFNPGCGSEDVADDVAPVGASALGPVGTLLLEAPTPAGPRRVYSVDTHLGAVGYGIDSPGQQPALMRLTADGTALLRLSLSAPDTLVVEAWHVLSGSRLQRWTEVEIGLEPEDGLPGAEDVALAPVPQRLLLWLQSGRWVYVDLEAGVAQAISHPSLVTMLDEGGPWPPWSPDGSHFLLRHDRSDVGGVQRWITLYQEGTERWSMPYEQPLQTSFAPNGHWLLLDGGWQGFGAVGRQAAFGSAQGRWLQLCHVASGTFAVLRNAAVGPTVPGDPLPFAADGRHLLREPLVAHAGLLAVDASVEAGAAVWHPIELSPVAEHLRGEVVATLPGADSLLAAEPAYCTQEGPGGQAVEGVCRMTLHQFRLDGPGLQPLVALEPLCALGVRECASGLSGESLAAPRLRCVSWATGELVLGGGALDPVSGAYTPWTDAAPLLSPDCSAQLSRTDGRSLVMRTLAGDRDAGSLVAAEVAADPQAEPLDWR